MWLGAMLDRTATGSNHHIPHVQRRNTGPEQSCPKPKCQARCCPPNSARQGQEDLPAVVRLGGWGASTFHGQRWPHIQWTIYMQTNSQFSSPVTLAT